MKYTIKDLSEGKCAVRNDGTVEELRKVLRLAFEENFGVVGWGRFYYKDHTRYACDNNTTLPTQSVKDFLVNETTEYKGKLKGFPKEVVDRMLDCQEEQGNKRDVTVFEVNYCSSFTNGGFDWDKTSEEVGFWVNILTKKNFSLFFERYPKMDKKYKGKAVHCETQEQWDFACEKLGRTSIVNYKRYGDCMDINNPNNSQYNRYWENLNYQVLSFQEWLDGNGYVFESGITNINNIKKEHSYKDYKEGDYVVITEFEGKTDWNHWFMPGEVLKLGGEEWEGNIKDSFDACSLRDPDGNGMPRHFEENYKIRKATQEEIDNSQWGEDKPISVREEGNVTVTEYAHQTIWKTNHIPLFTDQKPENVEIKLPELKVKLRNKRIRIKL